jgi:hypothetical protein
MNMKILLKRLKSYATFNSRPKNEQFWNLIFEFWSNILEEVIKSTHPNHMLAFYDELCKQAMTTDKVTVRLKCLSALELTPRKIEKLYYMCYDSSPDIRITLLKKYKGDPRFLKIPEKKLYRFLTQYFYEKNESVSREFSEFLVSFIVKPEGEQSSQEEIKDEENNGEGNESHVLSNDNANENQPKTVSFKPGYPFEGSRKKEVLLNFFDIFTL